MHGAMCARRGVQHLQGGGLFSCVFFVCPLVLRVRLLLVFRSWRALVAARRVCCVVAAGKEAPRAARARVGSGLSFVVLVCIQRLRRLWLARVVCVVAFGLR